MKMVGYTKLFGSIVTSTIWREDDKTRLVWITILALRNKFHIVEASIPGLADMARVSVEDCRTAISKLESPDFDSRTKEFEGRRIEPVDGGWRILNGEKYRQKMNQDERREYFRLKKRESRMSKKCPTLSKTVKDSQRPVKDSLGHSTMSTQSESESESEGTSTSPSLKEIKQSAPSRFVRPSIEEVKLQSAKIGLPDPEASKFFDYYESKGWKVGQSPMKSWTHALSGWKTRWEENGRQSYGNQGKNASKPNPRNIGICRDSTDYAAVAKRKSELAAQMAQAANRTGEREINSSP